MPTERVPLTTSVDPESSAGSNINIGAISSNVLYDRYPDGKFYATQRPAVNFTGHPVGGDEGRNPIGRGVYYWSAIDSYIVVIDDVIALGFGVNLQTIGDGRDPVYFIETDSHLLVIDPENNAGWSIPENSPSAVSRITDTGFPPNQTPSKQLAGGGAFIGGYACVMDTEGFVWNSAIGDPTNWSALDFIQAGREEDAGVFLTKHHDNLAAIGSTSVEFLYNAGNPVGSPFSLRQDISYRTGAISDKSVSTSGDKITFIGTQSQGSVGLYSVEKFGLKKTSSYSIDELLLFEAIDQGNDIFVTQALWNDHSLTFITPVTPGMSFGKPSWVPRTTYVFDGSTNLWSTYSIELFDLDGFAVIGVSDRVVGNNRNITFILTTGDVGELTGTTTPQDTYAGSEYFETDDYFVDNDDYVLPGQSSEESLFEMSVALPEVDSGRMPHKFGKYLWVVGNLLNGHTDTTNNIRIRWSDDHYTTYTPEREVSASMRNKLTRLGHYNRRAYEVRYRGNDPLRIEGLELYTGASSYA